jgi:hypothetical protein
VSARRCQGRRARARTMVTANAKHVKTAYTHAHTATPVIRRSVLVSSTCTSERSHPPTKKATYARAQTHSERRGGREGGRHAPRTHGPCTHTVHAHTHTTHAHMRATRTWDTTLRCTREREEGSTDRPHAFQEFFHRRCAVRQQSDKAIKDHVIMAWHEKVRTFSATSHHACARGAVVRRRHRRRRCCCCWYLPTTRRRRRRGRLGAAAGVELGRCGRVVSPGQCRARAVRPTATPPLLHRLTSVRPPLPLSLFAVRAGRTRCRRRLWPSMRGGALRSASMGLGSWCTAAPMRGPRPTAAASAGTRRSSV